MSAQCGPMLEKIIKLLIMEGWAAGMKACRRSNAKANAQAVTHTGDQWIGNTSARSVGECCNPDPLNADRPPLDWPSLFGPG